MGITLRWGRVPAWWVTDSRLDFRHISVLAVLATYANQNGTCSPAQGTLARHLKQSRPWVNKILGELHAMGFLEKTVRFQNNKGMTSCMYKIRMMPAEIDGGWNESGGIATNEGVTVETDGVSHGTGRETNNDTPCPRDDTSQSDIKQPDSGDGASAMHGDNNPPTIVPKGWEPSQNAIDQATKIAGNSMNLAEIIAHATHFAAKSRSRGYRYRRDNIDDAWVAWLCEDIKLSKGTGEKLNTKTKDDSYKLQNHKDKNELKVGVWAMVARSSKQKNGQRG